MSVISSASGQYDKNKYPKKGVVRMLIYNKIALFFVILFSVVMILNTYLGETERAQSNVIYLLMNGFAYIISAIDVEKRKVELSNV
jgi:hypothetical protein